MPSLTNHTYMSHSPIIKGFFILIIILSLGLILWLFHKNAENHVPPATNHNASNPYPVQIKGLNHTIYKNTRPVARIKADEIKINPRKFYIFNIKTINEITVINLSLEVYLYPEMEEKDLFIIADNIIPINKGKGTPKEFGILTRGIIKGITLRVYKSNRLYLTAKAEKAHMDFRNKTITLEKARIEEISTGKRIMSHSIIWDQRKEIFKIPNRYIAETPKGKATGQGIQFDLDFVFQPLN